MQKLEGAGVELACAVHGDGRPVLVIHGLASDAAAWEPFARDLATTARVVVYDRRGYGDSGMPEPYTGTTVEEQAEDAAALLRGLAVGAAVLVGDGLGALVALDLAKRHGALVRGMVLFEPPLFAFVPEATEELAAQRATLEEALRDGGPEAAVEAWLGEQTASPGGPVPDAGGPVPDDVRARARRAHQAFFADFAGLTSWPVTRGELRALNVPAAVLTGPHSPPHVVAAADALADLLPGARRAQDRDVQAATLSLLT
jgi:pimeloyl-ACP methyl ester carboxylesterase